jgi:hypothetical protein
MSNPKISATGSMSWYNAEGQRHREDGPAIDMEYAGYKAWFINGIQLYRLWEDGHSEICVKREKIPKVIKESIIAEKLKL